MTWNADDWQRLGDRFRWGRRKAGYSTKEGFAEAIGISSKTYGDIEAGRLAKRGSFSFDTIAQIEDALEWEPGVSRIILDGERSVDVYSGMLLPREGEDPWKDIGKVDDTDPTIAWLDERVERLEERVLKMERLVHAADNAGRKPTLRDVSDPDLSVEPSAAEPERKDVEGDTEGDSI